MAEPRLDHSFTTTKPIDESFATILDLEGSSLASRSVLEATVPGVRQGRDQGQDGRDVDEFTGTVEIVEQDADAHGP